MLNLRSVSRGIIANFSESLISRFSCSDILLFTLTMRLSVEMTDYIQIFSYLHTLNAHKSLPSKVFPILNKLLVPLSPVSLASSSNSFSIYRIKNNETEFQIRWLVLCQLSTLFLYFYVWQKIEVKLEIGTSWVNSLSNSFAGTQLYNEKYDQKLKLIWIPKSS